MTNQPNTIATGAIALHEMFTSLVDAGFTRKEALYLVGVQLTAVQQPKGGA